MFVPPDGELWHWLYVNFVDNIFFMMTLEVNNIIIIWKEEKNGTWCNLKYLTLNDFLCFLFLEHESNLFCLFDLTWERCELEGNLNRCQVNARDTTFHRPKWLRHTFNNRQYLFLHTLQSNLIQWCTLSLLQCYFWVQKPKLKHINLYRLHVFVPWQQLCM